VNHANGVTTAHPIASEAGWVTEKLAAHARRSELQPTRSDDDLPRWGREVEALDVAVYAAIAATPTPTLDRVFTAVSRAADHSKLWTAAAAALALVGGHPGRRAAVNGMASIALASTVVNVVLKPLGRRRRPDRAAHAVPLARQVAMPLTTSFPSGHAASALAFATGVTRELPTVGIPTHGAAAAVAYSRVHTGVHYPLDVIVGAVVGAALSPVAGRWLDRRRARRAGRDAR
jgi:membrane-associated phospholipid phosphatase